MMLPIQEVEMILSESEVLSSFVDPSIFWSLSQKPIKIQKIMIRINELESHRKDYADDAALTFEVDIQIDLWTKTLKEAQQIQPIIDDLMAKTTSNNMPLHLTGTRILHFTDMPGDTEQQND